MLKTQKSLVLPRNLAVGAFDELLILLSAKVNLLYLPYSTAQRCCLLLLILFAEHFCSGTKIDDSAISLLVFHSRTNLKLNNISVTPKLIIKVITILDLSKLSGLNCIPVAILKNHEPELSYILTELFIMCLKESCVLGFWKTLVSVFKSIQCWRRVYS